MLLHTDLSPLPSPLRAGPCLSRSLPESQELTNIQQREEDGFRASPPPELQCVLEAHTQTWARGPAEEGLVRHRQALGLRICSILADALSQRLGGGFCVLASRRLAPASLYLVLYLQVRFKSVISTSEPAASHLCRVFP